ncbi:MAG: insulinase family protein [Silvanigrellales bacterium]|nr:insulinase family protein [Silvanigrellales bacterium]
MTFASKVFTAFALLGVGLGAGLPGPFSALAQSVSTPAGGGGSALLAAPARAFEVGNGVKVETRILKNGLTVVIAKNPRAPLVSVYHWVKAGSLHEKPGITGIAHLFEHMMFRPLGEGKPGFFETARALGAQVNANTRFESTVYTSTVPRRGLEGLLQAEAARFRSLTVTDALLDVERRAVWSEYSTKFDADPTFDLWYTQYKAAFPGHPYEWMIIGFREDLAKISARDCNLFFQKYYRPNNVGLVIAGDVDVAETMALIEKAYGGWERGADAVLPPAFEKKPGLVKVTSKLPSGSKQALAGWRLPYFTKDDALLMEFVNHVLFDSGNDLASRRFVDREKVASSIGSFSFGYGHGMLSGFASVLPGVDDAKIIDAFRALKSDFGALSPKHFDAYRKEFQVSMAEGLERNESIVNALATAWGKYGDETLVTKWSREVPALTHEQTRGFVEKTMTDDNFVYVSIPTEPTSSTPVKPPAQKESK